jgi:hypothetical protein
MQGYCSMVANPRFARPLWILIAIFGGNLFANGTAQAQNVAPEISGTPPTRVLFGDKFDFRPTATDSNGDTIGWGVSNLPRWASFDKRTGRLHGAPGPLDGGPTRAITIAASDGKLSTSLPAFVINVVRARAPSISGTPPNSGRETEFYAFLPTASDSNGDTLSFAVKSKPSWATFDKRSGLLSGIPPAGSAGTYSHIQISATDGSSTVALAPFSITVGTGANRRPTISGTPVTSASTGKPYAFRPTASDPDGQVLSFTAIGKPAWAAFDATTGTLSGTPGPTDAGTYANIIIHVTDGTLTAYLTPFTIDVAKSNSAPRISGVPSGTALVDTTYSFTPSASDPDGQPLTFSIANLPAWASFDSSTGRLSGKPSSASVNTYSNIVISVSDGQLSASLPAFSLVVKAAAVSGSATLSWVPPTQKLDGTPLTNLAGFKIRYGQSAAALDQVLDIASPVVSTAVVENLGVGTWYFAIKAYTTDNVESDLSNLAQKTIN